MRLLAGTMKTLIARCIYLIMDIKSCLFVSLREKYPFTELGWSTFSRIRTEYGDILRISPYLVQMPENTDQNNSEYGHSLRSVYNSPCDFFHKNLTVKR